MCSCIIRPSALLGLIRTPLLTHFNIFSDKSSFLGERCVTCRTLCHASNQSYPKLLKVIQKNLDTWSLFMMQKLFTKNFWWVPSLNQFWQFNDTHMEKLCLNHFNIRIYWNRSFEFFWPVFHNRMHSVVTN